MHALSNAEHRDFVKDGAISVGMDPEQPYQINSTAFFVVNTCLTLAEEGGGGPQFVYHFTAWRAENPGDYCNYVEFLAQHCADLVGDRAGEDANAILQQAFGFLIEWGATSYEKGVPGDWEDENPILLRVELEEGGLTPEQWSGAVDRYYDVLTEELGDNNAVVAMFLDATDQDDHPQVVNSQRTKEWEDSMARLKAEGNHAFAKGMLQASWYRTRTPKTAALERWNQVTAKAKAAAMAGLPASPPREFTVYTEYSV